MDTPQAEAYPDSSRYNRVIRLPFSQDDYAELVRDATLFRTHLDVYIVQYPELFPPDILHGYRMKDRYVSEKLDIMFRRIEVGTVAYSIRPSFVLPHLRGLTDDVSGPLFLRKFDVPFWAIAHVHGKTAMYWYRLYSTLGRFSLLGTTIKDSRLLPENIAADEKHTKRLGEKVYVATVVANECILSAQVCEGAGNQHLHDAYGVFKREATELCENYSPKTVNTDAWPATMNAFKQLFPVTVMIRCFLHLYIKMRDRAKIKYRDCLNQAADKLWYCYEAPDKRTFSQRVRRLYDWAFDTDNGLPEVIISPIKKLKNNLSAYAVSYDYPGAHRTSNMLDRLMQRMDRHLFKTQYFQGHLNSAILNMRAWALIHNFAPSNPQTIKKYGGKFRSPAERLNQKIYHEDWLHNLLISSSISGYKPPPLNPL